MAGRPLRRARLLANPARQPAQEAWVARFPQHHFDHPAPKAGEVRTHFNLHTGGYTIDTKQESHRKGRKVTSWKMRDATTKALVVRGAVFKFAPAGHREFLEGPKEGRRNVHAWVYGTESYEPVNLSQGWRPCRYSKDPPCFVDMATGQCLPNDRSIDVYLGSIDNRDPVTGKPKPSRYKGGKALPWAPVAYWRPAAKRNPNEYTKAQYPYEVFYQRKVKGKITSGSVPIATREEAEACVRGMKRSPETVEAFIRKRNPDAILAAQTAEEEAARQWAKRHKASQQSVLAEIGAEHGWTYRGRNTLESGDTRLSVLRRGGRWFVEQGPIEDPSQHRGKYGGTVASLLHGPDGKVAHSTERAALRTAIAFMRQRARRNPIQNPYLSKFIPPGGKGYQYVYSEEDVALRHAKKAQRIEALKHKEAQLRQAIERDVAKGDDTALAAGLILATYERPGNPGSAKEGHYGVTGWECRHLSVDGRKAVIDYIGKSGVHQTKEVDNPTLVRALSRKAKGCTRRGGKLMRVSASAVNRYLDSFDISSKDLRTFGANTEMQKELRLARRAGPDLSTLKSRDVRRVLKAEFNAALGVVAGRLGHTTSVLRKQYLVSSIEPTYLESGSIVQTFA